MAKPHLKPDSLALTLYGAAQALALVQAGSALPPALARITHQLALNDAARGAQQDIAYRAMRQWGRAGALLARLAERAPQSPQLACLLRCSLALLCQDDANGDRPYNDFTLVDQAVAAAAASPKTAHARGMVNAILRRFLRERAALLEETLRDDPVARWNYPRWWIAKMRADYPDAWQAILAAGNAPPPLTLRVNRRRGTPAAYLAELEAAGIAARQIGPDAVRLARPMPVHAIPGFLHGRVSVQDAGAQLAAPLLDATAGMRVLDACAAPGGKTGHLLECADIDLLALDSDAERLARIGDNLGRLQLAARLQQADASRDDWWDGQPFDRILADVPCTASGVVRRHPDIRWLRRPQDADRLATLSAQILDNLWRMLKPDGKLLLVTCSLWPEESARQAQAFASRNGAEVLATPGQLLPGAEGDTDHDGLFYALFRKPVTGGGRR